MYTYKFLIHILNLYNIRTELPNHSDHKNKSMVRILKFQV